MAVQLTDGTTANVVDATSKGILVQNPKVATQGGFVNLGAQVDAGAVLGTQTVRAVSASIDERLTAGLDTTLLIDSFNYTAQNTTNWSNNLTTMTLTYSGGYAFLNAGASVASGAFAVLKSYRTFPLFQAGGLHCEFRGYLTQAPQTNNTVYIGLGIPGTTAAPTDGIYFQFDATGILKAVVNNNGTLSTSAALTAPSANATHEFAINVTDDNSEFSIDGVLQAIVPLPTGASLMTLSASASVFVQNTNTGAVGAAQGVKIAFVALWQLDIASGKPWQHQMAGQGMVASQGQNGGSLGTTALYSNSLAPGAGAVMTNTTAALGSGLGGQFAALPTLAANTDGIVCSYQNPAPTVNLTGRMLMITGITINSVVTTVLAGNATPVVYIYSLAYGHTAVSMATAEGATAKAPRRIPLGAESFGAAAAVGTLGSSLGVRVQFGTPIPVNPGEFIALCAKNVGVVTTTGVVTFLVGFDGYWE